MAALVEQSDKEGWPAARFLAAHEIADRGRRRIERHLVEARLPAKGDLNVDWLLPYTRPRHFAAGDVVMARGDYATAAYYIVSGEVELLELGQTFGKGTLLGEIGLFAPDGRRMATVRCRTDVHAAMIDYDRFKELYFQNPQFGFRLLHLIVARLQRSRELPSTAVPS
jgi:CRP/FNR family transcriptional regulator, cyclic AMP receptor protein